MGVLDPYVSLLIPQSKLEHQTIAIPGICWSERSALQREHSVPYFWDYSSPPNYAIFGSEILHGLLIHKNIRIPLKKKNRDAAFLLYYAIFDRT